MTTRRMLLSSAVILFFAPRDARSGKRKATGTFVSTRTEDVTYFVIDLDSGGQEVLEVEDSNSNVMEFLKTGQSGMRVEVTWDVSKIITRGGREVQTKTIRSVKRL